LNAFDHSNLSGFETWKGSRKVTREELNLMVGSDAAIYLIQSPFIRVLHQCEEALKINKKIF